jgi:hypothetical protein
MTDNSKELVKTLSEILPTHYEMTLSSKTATPCISWMELNNYSVTDSQFSSVTLGYSRITYQIKVWGNKLADLYKYALDIDRVLRPLGYKRISTGELYDNNSTMIQKILTYEILATENYL